MLYLYVTGRVIRRHRRSEKYLGSNGRSGRHMFVLVGSNPTVVTDVEPVLAVGVDGVAERSPWRSPGALVPRSRRCRRREPSRTYFVSFSEEVLSAVIGGGIDIAA